MKINELGRTGIWVSEIGMGCEGFVDKTFECPFGVQVMENMKLAAARFGS